MKHLRTIKRSDLGRLVYKYSMNARIFGIDIDFAYGKGNAEYFKRCPFNYIMTKKMFITANPACCGF